MSAATFESPGEAWVAGLSMMPTQMGARSGSPSILKDPNSKKLDRPKSTPPGLKVTFGNNSTAHYASLRGRPTTTTGRDSYECERVYQVEHEPTRKHGLDSHLQTKRPKPPPWQKQLESPMRPVSVGNGYILSKSKEKVHMHIKTGDFFEPVPDETHHNTRFGDPERESLIAQLQEQINDLTLYLEEEKLNHKDTRRRMEDQLKDRLSEQKSSHNEFVNNLEERYKDELEMQKLNYEREIKDQKIASENAIGKLKGEIEFLHGSFNSYKTSLTIEMQEKWAIKEADIRMTHEEELEEALHKLRVKLIQEKNIEKQELEKEAQRERALQQREHKKEMDSLVRKFSNAAADLEKLKKTAAELEDVKNAHKLLNDKYDLVCKQFTKTTHELTDTKLKLLEYEENFQDKVATVDDKYKEQIHDLMMKNTELRRMYVKKCGQLFDEKAESEKSFVQDIQNAKDTMHTIINTRNRAMVNLAGGDLTLDDKPRKPFERPTSAPVTRPEAETAHLTASQTEHLNKEGTKLLQVQPTTVKVALNRPKTSLGTMEYEVEADVSSAKATIGDNAESEAQALHSLG
ncbi:unnamed protein product [Owenia fusiformis]|uniref:Uncharacterized protein n=1 Tax=Owenia fusiformis TaxID=6347 RepID=A0A8J1TS66_OWEFU|nr:unnamed protein product [Owenia fusiformis]